MKILVTGANGYLGSGIVKELLDKGCNVIATDIDDCRIDERADRICCDLFSVDNPYDFFLKPDMVLHLAWRNGFVHNSESHIYDLPNHYRFLSSMIDGGIKRIAIMGSMHEIGFYEGPIKENTPTKPQTYYGIAKNSLRQLMELKCQNGNVSLQWLRGFYIGNSPYGASIFSKITKAAQEGKTTFPFTSGMNQYDFLDYSIFCQYVADAVIQDKVTGIINICSGFPERLKDRVERFINDNNYHIKLLYGTFSDRAYDSKAIWGDDSKIKEIEKFNGK